MLGGVVHLADLTIMAGFVKKWILDVHIFKVDLGKLDGLINGRRYRRWSNLE